MALLLTFGLVAQRDRDWNSLQECGGLRVLDPVVLRGGTVLLPVACDVSGLRAITTEPRVLDSGSVVVRTDATVVDHGIRLSIVTDLAGVPGASSRAPPARLSGLAAGEYAVEYANPDGSLVPLRSITLPVAATSDGAHTTGRAGTWPRVADSWFRAAIAPEATLARQAVPIPDESRLKVDFPVSAVVDGFWTPTAAEVRRAEARIVETLVLSRWAPDVALGDLDPDRRAWSQAEIGKILGELAHFDVQVAGLVVDGKRTIVANFFGSGNRFGQEDDWVVVEDGGFWFWRIRYDLDTDRCLAFDSNGYA